MSLRQVGHGFGLPPIDAERLLADRQDAALQRGANHRLLRTRRQHHVDQVRARRTEHRGRIPIGLRNVVALRQFCARPMSRSHSAATGHPASRQPSHPGTARSSPRRPWRCARSSSEPLDDRARDVGRAAGAAEFPRAHRAAFKADCTARSIARAPSSSGGVAMSFRQPVAASSRPKAASRSGSRCPAPRCPGPCRCAG